MIHPEIGIVQVLWMKVASVGLRDESGRIRGTKRRVGNVGIKVPALWGSDIGNKWTDGIRTDEAGHRASVISCPEVVVA